MGVELKPPIFIDIRCFWGYWKLGHDVGWCLLRFKNACIDDIFNVLSI